MTGPDVTLPQGRREWPERLTVGMLGSDEVRAYRAEGTCHDTMERPPYQFTCSECGAQLDVMDDSCESTLYVHGHATAPSYCPNCGARIEGVGR